MTAEIRHGKKCENRGKKSLDPLLKINQQSPGIDLCVFLPVYGQHYTT